jgi:large repetitive protein
LAGRVGERCSVQFGAANHYSYVGNDPLDRTDPTGDCPECIGAFIGAGLELAFQLTDPAVRADYANAGSQLLKGDFSGALSSAGAHVADVGIAAGAGAIGAFGTGKVAAIAGKLAESAGAGKVAVIAAKVAGAGTVQGANSAAAKAASNGVNGRDEGEGVGTAAVVGAVVGGPLSVAGRAVEGLVPAGAGRVATQVTQAATKAASGAAKKEAACVAKTGEAC